MAQRPAFFIGNGVICKKEVDFEWAPGFSASQKKKNVERMHEQLSASGECLEVSTKSDVSLGNRLSAFNLKIDGIALENWFQAGKVFELVGPYTDLLTVSPV